LRLRKVGLGLLSSELCALQVTGGAEAGLRGENTASGVVLVLLLSCLLVLADFGLGELLMLGKIVGFFFLTLSG
jgi:hypothetical protein